MGTKKLDSDSVDENLLGTCKKQGTLNSNEYEYTLCAFFALKLSISQHVVDFEITAKDESYANFNDIALKVKFKDKTSKTYRFKIPQAKERDNDFNLINILNYCQETEESSICIFYTTQDVKFPTQENVIEKCEAVIPEDLNTGTVFKIEITHSERNFRRQFYLLSNQNNLEIMKSGIEGEFKQLLDCEEVAHTFVEFMKGWWSGNFILRKQDVIAKIAELALSPAIRDISDKNCNEKTKLLTDAIMNFEMTLVEDADDEIAQTIWQPSVSPRHINLAALKYGLSAEETVDKLTPKKKIKVLWYLNKVPLIVKTERCEEVRLKNVIRLLEKCEPKRKILLLGNISRDEFYDWRVFENLSDLTAEDFYEDIIQHFRISLQGRPCLPLKQLINVIKDASAVETRQLLQMSQQDLVIDRIEEKLPSDYISRSISASFFNTKKLLNNYEILKNDLVIVFNYDKKQCKELIKLNNVEIVELSDYRWLIHPHNEDKRKKKTPLVVLTDKCSDVQFDEICNATEKQNVYVVQIVDEECCKLIMGKQNTNKSEELYIEESKIHSFCQAPINVICSQAGMGKSTMMTFLANNSPPDLWTVRVNLKDHEQFLKKKAANEEVLPYFLHLNITDRNSFTCRIKSGFLKSARIYLFLDGLNEIDSSSIDFVLNYVKYISSTGVHVWLSSRENLKEKITTHLCVFPMNIKEVHTEQQKQYLQKRLGPKYESDKAEMIVTKIKQLKLPLLLYMMSEVRSNDDKFYEKLDQRPVVLQIYEAFFNGKLKGQSDLEQYEYSALAACLEAAILKKLGLDMTNSQEFLKKIKNVGDKFGIISHCNDEDRAVFAHQTYVEYFAALWMSKNFDKVRLLGDEFFGKKYQDLRIMFDIITSEKCPLHLAVIYKNPDQIKKYLEYFGMKDKGGRSAFHLYCSYSMTSQEIFHLPDLDSFANDNVFQWNCLDYAVAAESLFSVEMIVKRFGNSVKLDHLYQRYDDNTLAFYSCKFGYPNLLAALFRKNADISTFVSPNGYSLLHVAVEDEDVISDDFPMRKVNTSKIIDILISNGTDVNIRDNNGATALHYASKFGIPDAVQQLLVHNADVQATTKAKETALHFSLLEQPNLEIVKLLIDAGIDVNAKDEDGNIALHLAAARGSYEIAKILIEKGSDIKAVTSAGETVLHVACNDISDIKMVELLLENNVDINTKDQRGKNALHTAAENGNYKIVELLIEKGGDAKTLTRSKETTLHHVFKKEPNINVIELLLKSGVDQNVVSKNGLTALHLAIEYGNYDVVKLLIDRHADIDLNLTILHYAILHNASEEITTLLLDNGVDINAKDRSGKSALHLAIDVRNHKMVHMLIERGADINAMTSHNETVLTYTIKRYPNLDIIAILLNNAVDLNIRSEQGVTALYEAVSKGNYQIVKSLIEKGANIDVVNHDNLNVLHYAARADDPNLQIIKLLLEHAINVNAKTKDGETPLHLIAKSGSYAVIKTLIESGADVKAITSSNKTVLYYALQREPDVKVIKLLLDNGIDANEKDIDEVSALHLAAYSGNYEIVKALLERGSDIKATTSSNKTVLHYAFMGNTNMEVIKLLLERGVDVNEKDEAGESALYLAAVQNDALLKVLINKDGDVKIKTNANETVLHNLISKGDPTIETVELLLNNGVDVDAKDRDGLTALHCAAKYGDHEIIQVLIGKNSDINAETHDSESVLHYAVKHETNANTVKLLLNSGANCGKKDKRGNTALHLAAQRGSYETLKLLIDNGADVNATTYSNKTVLHCAFEEEPDLELIKLLLDSGCDVNVPDNQGVVVLHLAAEKGSSELMEILLAKGADLAAVTHSNKTALHFATKGESIEIVNLLLRSGIDIDAKNEYGESALHIAAESESYDLMKALVENGANLQSKTYVSETVLHYLFKREPNLQILKLLLDHHVDINAQDINGLSALHLAVRSGNSEIVNLLIEKGADVTAKTSSNETVLHYACVNGDILEFLLNHDVDLNVKNKSGATVLHLAAAEKNSAIVEMLVAKGADLRAITYSNETLLHYAVKGNPQIKFIKSLLSNGVDPNVQDANGLSALHIAVDNGDSDIVQVLLEAGANINSSTYTNETLLHAAIRRSNLDIIKLLLNRKCNLEEKDKDGKTALYLAVEKRNYECVKMLLESGADVKIRMRNKESILHCAIKEKPYLDIIKLLLNHHDIDPSVHDKDGISSLHLCAETGNLEVLKALIEKGANLESTTDTTILHYAINNSTNIDIVKLLLDNGLKVNARDGNGITALFLAAKEGNYAVAKLLVERGANVVAVSMYETVLFYALKKCEPNKEIVKLLLDKRVNVNAKNYNEVTCLHRAAKKGNYKILKMLMENGGDITAVTNSKETILHYALKKKPNVDIIKLLLASNIDIQEDYYGVTPIHLAVQAGNFDILKMLVAKGADLMALTDSNDSVLHYVFKRTVNMDIFTFLLDNDVNPDINNDDDITPLHLAAETQNYEMVKTLIDKGAIVNESILPHVFENIPHLGILELLANNVDLNWKNRGKQSVLQLAIKKGSYEIVKYLIEKGVDLKTMDTSNRTLLHYAFFKNPNIGIIKLLLNHEINVNAEDAVGWTPLHAATKYGTYEMVKMLIEKSANIKAKTKKNQTVLNYIYDDEITEEPRLEIVNLLIENGVDLNENDENGISVLHNAAASGHYNVAKMLIEKGADVHSVTIQNDTVLNYACQFKTFTAEVTQLLIDSGVNANQNNHMGRSPLETAYVNENYGVVKLLRRHGAICNKKEVNEAIGILLYNAPTDEDTLTGFFSWAAENRHENLMEFAINKGAIVNLYSIAKSKYTDWILAHRFIDSGADVNAKDSNGATALHWACKHSNYDLVKLLLNKDADINATTKTKETPLHYAMKGWDTCGTRWLIPLLASKRDLDINSKDQNGLTPLHLAALCRNLTIVNALIDRNADVEAVSRDEETVLHFAVKGWKNNVELVEELIEQRKVNINAVDKNGVSALHLAAAKGDSEVAKALLGHGAEINAVDSKKKTALHYLIEKWIVKGNVLHYGSKICQNSPEVLELFLEYGIDVNATDKDGVSPLHLAVNNGHYDLVNKLIEKGANVNAATSKGETVLDYAVNSKVFSKEVVKLLIQSGAEKTTSILQFAAEKGYDIS